MRELAMRFHVDEPLPFSVFVRNVAQHKTPYQLRREQTYVRAKLRAAQNHELRIIARCRFNVYAAERYAPRTHPTKSLLKEAQLKASARFCVHRTSTMPGFKESFCTRCCVAFGLKLRQDILLVLMMIGVVVGFIVGVAINGYVNAVENPEERKTLLILIGFPGELFINMLKMLVLPLIVASLVCALAGIDTRASGKIGRRAIIYYLCTTVSAVIIGIAVVTIIKPGNRAKPSEDSEVSPYRPLDAFLDLLR